MHNEVPLISSLKQLLCDPFVLDEVFKKFYFTIVFFFNLHIFL